MSLGAEVSRSSVKVCMTTRADCANLAGWPSFIEFRVLICAGGAKISCDLNEEMYVFEVNQCGDRAFS